MKLFACYLGGMAPWCNIELHDLQFSVGEKIEDCFPDLQAKRFGDKNKVHLDSFLELKYIDGYEVVLRQGEKSLDIQKLFVLNAGGYLPDYFGEKHEIGFCIAEKKNQTRHKLCLKNYAQITTRDIKTTCMM